MTSLTDDVRRSAMVCILTVPATMTSHDLMKLMAPFNDVMEHMKIIRDSTPNQYMVLIKFSTQVRVPPFSFFFLFPLFFFLFLFFFFRSLSVFFPLDQTKKKGLDVNKYFFLPRPPPPR